MRHTLIFIYLSVFPVLCLGQSWQTDGQPTPSSRGGYVVARKKKTGKIESVRVGYDNYDCHQYLTIKAKANENIKAVERVIFEYNKDGLKIYTYIPKINENLDKKLLKPLAIIPKDEVKGLRDTKDKHKPDNKEKVNAKIAEDPVKYSYQRQEKTAIQLYVVVKAAPDGTNIKDPVTKSDKIIGELKRSNRLQLYKAELEKELDATTLYQDPYYKTGKTLRDIFRTYKRPRWYAEFGGLTGFSYRTIQVVNPLPNRPLHQSRLQEDKAQLSAAVIVRSGYSVNTSSSIYGGLVYLHQGLESAGKVDWNTGLVTADPSGVSKKKLNYLALELGYSYNVFSKTSDLSVDLGLLFSRAAHPETVHRFTWGPNIAIGPKIRIGPNADLRVMPTLYYNIRPLEKHQPGPPPQELATRMFTTGLRVSIRYY